MTASTDTTGGYPAGIIESRMLIGGEWVDSADGRTIDVENPARKQSIGRVPRGGAPVAATTGAGDAATCAAFNQAAGGDQHRLSAYVYLKNRIFVNAYLIKVGFGSPDLSIEHRLKDKFIRLQNRAAEANKPQDLTPMSNI